MDLDLGQLRALSAAVAEGTFEAAARALHVTPSAISQRIKGLEVATGQVLLVRSKPVQVTPSGQVVLRLARQVEALLADAAAELGESAGGAVATPMPIAVNADSLATWVLPALASVGDSVAFDVHREDQAHTSELLRRGTVMAAVTADAEPVPGCSVTRLGAMRYRPLAAPAFAARWFADGVSARALARAPVVVFDRRDDLQHAYLRRRGRGRALDPPLHHVPASADFLAAIRLGLGWGMLPDLQSAEEVRAGRLVDVDPRGAADVVLHWQQWRLRSPALDRVAAAVIAAAREQLDQGAGG
jgi:LysR family transcriptional regulator (chromosome initiation inhibitor)